MFLLRRVLGHPATQALARRPWVPPTAAFAAVYGALWIVWAVTAGRGAWTPAHPRLRTILILAACAAPLWAALMLALTLVDTSRCPARRHLPAARMRRSCRTRTRRPQPTRMRRS
jgi:hypothetical protein